MPFLYCDSGAHVTTLVVDATGTIRWIDVHPEYVNRSEPALILAAYDDAL